MKLELREVCTRFTEDLEKKFGESLKTLKDKQPTSLYYREKCKVDARYHSWIHGHADELGNRYEPKYYFEHTDDIKQLLTDHMFRLTKNVAIKEWLERGDYGLWDTIVNDMYKLDHIDYSQVLYRFTYSAIINYLHFMKKEFNKYDESRCIMETQEKEKLEKEKLEKGEDMYNTLEKQLAACLNVKKCAYWSTTEE